MVTAPSNTTWGNIITGSTSTRKGKIGIAFANKTTTATKVTGTIQVWFWSMYDLSDSNNSFYFNPRANPGGAAITLIGSKTISHTVGTGSGWSTSNQTLLYDKPFDFDRGTEGYIQYFVARLTGIDNLGSGEMKVEGSINVPSLEKYTVSYNANGGSGAPSSQTKTYGIALTLSSTKPTRTGYTFKGWATSSGGSVAYASGASYTANKAVTLYAVWERISYAVKYNANANDASGMPANQTKYYGTALTLSSTKPTRTGYTFAWWNTKSDGSGTTYNPGASYTSNAALTLYAVWARKKYTVTYYGNNGLGSPATQTKYHGETLTLSSTKPTRTGYTFVSWNTKSDGSGSTYNPGASYALNATLDLYAIWKLNTYTVTYDPNGGTLAGDKTQTKEYGKALKLTGTATRTNYAFKGWATSKNGSVAYASGANYTANASVTLYAVWELSYVKPKISSFSVTRCNSSGTATADGVYARVKFNWTSSVSNSTVLIEWKDTATQSKTINLSGTSGTVNQVVGGSFSADKTYSISVTIDDGKDPQSMTKSIFSVAFAIDVLAGGKGVAVGKAAETSDQFDCGFNSRFRKNSMFGNKTGYLDGNTGVYIDAGGFIHIQRSSAQGYHPYLGFFIDDEKENAAGQIRVNSSTKQMEFLSAAGYKFGASLYLPNQSAIYGADKNDTFKSVFQAQNDNGNTVIGFGNYNAKSGNTNIYGNDVLICSAAASSSLVRPYFRTGDTISVTWNGAGFVSSSMTKIYFAVPLARPVIGSPVVTVASVNGLTLRQNNTYTHGSTAEAYVKPASYSAGTSADGSFVLITATMSNTTNAVNNSPIGIQFNGTITFSSPTTT